MRYSVELIATTRVATRRLDSATVSTTEENSRPATGLCATFQLTTNSGRRINVFEMNDIVNFNDES
jgi:hypothetical protein